MGARAARDRTPAAHAQPPELRRSGCAPDAAAAAGRVAHLYVHLPFCAHRCGYCDFVTVVGRRGAHDGYVASLLRELELHSHLLAAEVESVYLGGGTPTLLRRSALERLLAGLPAAQEVTVEANPETVTAELAQLLRRNGVTRVSIGAQTFHMHLLDVLERRARPEDVKRAVYTVRNAGFDNVSLDLIYGIPGQTPADLACDLDEALALEPEHVSAYELEAKSGTRFTHRHGRELEHRAESMEGYFEQVTGTLTAAGYRWYETANFCRLDRDRDLRCRHNLGYWLGRDYVGLGVGAVTTIENTRWRNTPSLARYVGALTAGTPSPPPREVEPLPVDVRRTERVMLGLRLDEPLPLAGLESALDARELARLAGLGLVERRTGTVTLTRRGRFLGGGVTARLLA